MNIHIEKQEDDFFPTRFIVCRHDLREGECEQVVLGYVQPQNTTTFKATRNGFEDGHTDRWKMFQALEAAIDWVQTSPAIPPAAPLGMQILNPGKSLYNIMVGFRLIQQPFVGYPIRSSDGEAIVPGLLLENGKMLHLHRKKWFSSPHTIKPQNNAEKILRHNGMDILADALIVANNITSAHEILHIQSCIRMQEANIRQKIQQRPALIKAALPFRRSLFEDVSKSDEPIQKTV